MMPHLSCVGLPQATLRPQVVALSSAASPLVTNEISMLVTGVRGSWREGLLPSSV